MPYIITIDGPSGSGKGTVSRLVAKALGFALLDSGALYRLVALAGLKAGVGLTDGPALARLASRLDIRFGSTNDGTEQIWLGVEDVTRAIRSEEAGNNASIVAALIPVREALLDRQRRFAQNTAPIRHQTQHFRSAGQTQKKRIRCMDHDHDTRKQHKHVDQIH